MFKTDPWHLKNKAMNCIYNIYNKEAFSIPSANWDWIGIKWIVEDYSFVKKGEVLGTVKYTSILYLTGSRKEQVFNIVSPCDGYFYIIQESGSFGIKNENIRGWDNKLLASVLDNSQELFSYYYCCEGSMLETDPYTGFRNIVFNYWDGFPRKTSLWEDPDKITFDNYDCFSVVFYEEKMMFSFVIRNKLKLGDCISLLFEDGKIIDFPITTKPKKISAKECETTFVSYLEDVETLLYSTLVSFRVSFKDESTYPVTVNIEPSLLNGPEAFRAYVKNHLDAIKLLVPDYQLPRRTVAKTPIEYKFNWCYVYLMRDNTNGYHKIGISNKPEYREKTLQSEKPSIEMLACKKFPTRKIAEAIESALHTAYSQQRVRGEWFNLDDVDVAAIIETLK